MDKNGTDTCKLYENYLTQINGINMEIKNKEDLLKAQEEYSNHYVKVAFSDEDFLESLEAMDKQTDDLLEKHVQSGESSLFLSGRNEVIVSPSAKNPGEYQITFFDKKGAVSDNQRETIEEVLKELKGNHCIPLRKEFAEFVVEPKNKEVDKMEKKIEELYEDILDLESVAWDIREYEGFTDEDFELEAKGIVDNYMQEEARILADDSTSYQNDDLLKQELNKKQEEYLKDEKKNMEAIKERLEELPEVDKQIEDKFSELKEELDLPEDMTNQEVVDEVSNVLFPEDVDVERESDEAVYVYDGQHEPQKFDSMYDLSIENDSLGEDVTQQVLEYHIDYHSDSPLEEQQQFQLLSEYGVWINLTKEQLQEYNESIGLDKDEHLQGFEGHEQLFPDRETKTYLDRDNELEL